MPQYKQADIVLARIPDPEGRSIPWAHPAIIVNKTSTIIPGNQIVLLGITKSFHRPLAVGHFLLPWREGGHAETGLSCECVAKCNWVTRVDYSLLEKRIGFTPPHIWEQIMVELIARINEKKRRQQAVPKVDGSPERTE